MMVRGLGDRILLANAPNIKMGAFGDARIALERVRKANAVKCSGASSAVQIDDHENWKKTLDKVDRDFAKSLTYGFAKS